MAAVPLEAAGKLELEQLQADGPDRQAGLTGEVVDRDRSRSEERRDLAPIAAVRRRVRLGLEGIPLVVIPRRSRVPSPNSPGRARGAKGMLDAIDGSTAASTCSGAAQSVPPSRIGSFVPSARGIERRAGHRQNLAALLQGVAGRNQ